MPTAEEIFVTWCLSTLTTQTAAKSRLDFSLLSCSRFWLALPLNQKLERVLNIAGERTQPFISDATFF